MEPGSAVNETQPGQRSMMEFAATFGSALALGQAAQFVWLAAGSRAFSTGDFGRVLAAQALYGLLQVVMDTGSTYYGARLVAAGTLDDEALGSITALRLVLACGAGCVLLIAGALGGARSFAAMAPFALATLLFALFRYWQSFGHGDSRPLSAYVVLRGAAPAGVALFFAGAGIRFPLPLPGAIECGAIVLIATALRLHPLEALRLASRARALPWRAVLDVALPFAASQTILTLGTVLLALTGSAVAAAVFGVATRLLTGVNQVAGVVTGSLFPWLARPGDLKGADVLRAVRAILIAAGAASCVAFAAPSLILRSLLGHDAPNATATVVIAVSLAAATSYVLLITTIMIARHHESEVSWVFVVGTAIAIAGAVAVVVLEPAAVSTWMAASLGCAQVALTSLLAWRARRILVSAARAISEGAVGALVLAGAGSLAAAVPVARAPLAAGTGAAVFALLALLALDVRRGRRTRTA